MSQNRVARGLTITSTSVKAYYVPRFLSPIPLSIYILFYLYLYSEGTQASTLWRVSSWSPSRSCSFPLCLIISVDSHPHC